MHENNKVGSTCNDRLAFGRRPVQIHVGTRTIIRLFRDFSQSFQPNAGGIISNDTTTNPFYLPSQIISYNRDAKIPVARPPWRIHFVRWRTIFLNPQLWKFWQLEFLGSP
jgi:hypothetical protein